MAGWEGQTGTCGETERVDPIALGYVARPDYPKKIVRNRLYIAGHDRDRNGLAAPKATKW